MSDITRISPMLDNFDIGGSISEHNGVQCYPAMEKGTDSRYIVKSVSIPASQTQLDALLLTGAFSDATAALDYFKELADQIVGELETLKKLSESEGFLPYENWQSHAMDDGIGFDIYMIGSYKQTLRKYCKKQPITHLGAVNLGLDICTALAVCRRAGYLYVDLKPNNIYVLDDHQFRIGDLGFISLSSLAYASLPDRYRSEYTAPEITDAFATLNDTLDIYALGLILYQIYNGGELPVWENDVLPPPLNADYEMAEIILKACALDPQQRWQDPIQFGQALVSYMQRNGANDTPIVSPEIVVDSFSSPLDDIDLSDIDLSDVPLAEDVEMVDTELAEDDLSDDDTFTQEVEDSDNEEPDIPEEVPVPAEAVSAEEHVPEEPSADELAELISDPVPSADEDNLENLSFFEDVSADETSPENNLTDVDYDEVSAELNEILAHADELVSHPVPAPVVAPEPVEIQIPTIEAETPQSDEESGSSYPEGQDADNSSHQDATDSDYAPTVIIPVSQPDEAEAPDDISEPESLEEDIEEPVRKKKSPMRWILNTILILLILAIIAVGLFYYKNIYLLPIQSINVSGDESSMVITLNSSIDESLLHVICSDSHGSQITAPVVNGTATFSNLAPDTAYTIRVVVDGFHRLTGETAASYSTPAQTNIVQFNAVTGSEDGSVILSFTVEGPDSGNWSLQYSASGEEQTTVELLSHMITLNGLTIGKEYTFTLVPGEDMYVTGQDTLTFVASELIRAEDVNIVSCVDNVLTVTWKSPDASSITEWTVCCYDDAEYKETIITADTSASFENIDPSKAYTIEVTAAGMSQGQRTYMAANAITITNFEVDQSANQMTVSWDASAPTPKDGWILLYSVDGSKIQSSVTCSDNSAVISPIVPDAEYTFTLQQTNGDAVLTTPLQYRTSKAQDFSGYGMIRSSMTYKLCKRPSEADWEYSDLSDSDYTKTFKVGEDISIVGQLHDKYGISKDEIVVMYVFRNSDNEVVSYCYSDYTWNEMWYKYFGEFDVPQAPSEPGEYTLHIYFNGKLVTKKDVVIES